MIVVLVLVVIHLVALVLSVMAAALLLGVDFLLLPNSLRRWLGFPPRRARRPWTPWD